MRGFAKHMSLQAAKVKLWRMKMVYVTKLAVQQAQRVE